MKSAHLKKSREKEDNLEKVCKQIYKLRAVETASTNIDTKLGLWKERIIPISSVHRLQNKNISQLISSQEKYKNINANSKI